MNSHLPILLYRHLYDIDSSLSYNQVKLIYAIKQNTEHTNLQLTQQVYI